MNYYRRYIGDYQRDTVQLTLLEHGAYGKLLDAYYACDGSIPADEATLFRIAGAMEPDEQAAVRTVAARYFKHHAGRLSNARADAEIAIGLKAIEIARENGKKGGRPAGNNPAGKLEETQRDTQRVSATEPSGVPSRVPSAKAIQPPSPIPQEVPTKPTLQLQPQLPSRTPRKRRAASGPMETWLTPACAAWEANPSTGPFKAVAGQAAREFKALTDDGFSPDEIGRRLAFYLEMRGDPQGHDKAPARRGTTGWSPNLRTFALTFGNWNPDDGEVAA